MLVYSHPEFVLGVAELSIGPFFLRQVTSVFAAGSLQSSSTNVRQRVKKTKMFGISLPARYAILGFSAAVFRLFPDSCRFLPGHCGYKGGDLRRAHDIVPPTPTSSTKSVGGVSMTCDSSQHNACIRKKHVFNSRVLSGGRKDGDE